MTPAGSEGAGEDRGIGEDLPRSCIDDSAGGTDDSGAYSTSEDCIDDDDFAEPALSTEQRLRLVHIWVANPSIAHEWTHEIGGVLLYDDILEVRTYFDAAESQFERQELSTVAYEEFVVYDFSEPPIYVVDQEGIVFESQSSSSSAAHGTGVCTQESKNVKGNLKVVLELEEEDAYEGSGGSDCEEEEEMDDEGSEEEEVVHYEGDTEDEDTVVLHEKKKKKKQKLPVRRGLTTRSHSSVLEKEEPEFKPSSDEEEKGLLKEADDDGFEPLSFLLPKKRKSGAKQRPPRKWYNEKMEQPCEQLCLKMCPKDQHQFREALLNLHITQGRNFKYHSNLDQRIIVQCKQEHCNFFMVATAIKGETTFVIKKIRIEHTCPVSTDTTRVRAKWLAVKYESLFRSDITTGIHTLIDACMEKYNVDVPKSMAYRAKNLAIEALLGEHKKQYPRLRDYAQTVMDTNPESRVIVLIVTTTPTAKIPHQGPRFHAMFYCINGAREGFLKGCRPFIGVGGCFIKLTTSAQLLAATGRDGNNNIYPLAFGIVGQEDATSWCWFLHQLKICLGGEVGQFGPYTIMSNRQKGLLNAVNPVFPKCNQRFCVRNMYANFQNVGFRGEDLKKYMDNDVYAYSEPKFNIGMNDLRGECEEAWKWLCAIPNKT
ncbi:wd repeat-containing protein 43 [Hordeum vulgare]|nr:wd repeat-containing protein 43 [Hordeum vulgare]